VIFAWDESWDEAFYSAFMARARTRRRGYLEQLPSGSVRRRLFIGTDPLTGRPRYLRETCACKLDAELLERLYARLHRCREVCNGRPPKAHTCRSLSSSTTRKIHYITRGALDRAVRWRYLSVNPAELVEAPSPRRTKPDPVHGGGGRADQ
jgi:hypothetical protein